MTTAATCNAPESCCQASAGVSARVMIAVRKPSRARYPGAIYPALGTTRRRAGGVPWRFYFVKRNGGDSPGQRPCGLTCSQRRAGTIRGAPAGLENALRDNNERIKWDAVLARRTQSPPGLTTPRKIRKRVWSRRFPWLTTHDHRRDSLSSPSTSPRYTPRSRPAVP